MNIKSKMLLCLLCICFLFTGCDNQNVESLPDIASVNIPNLQLYDSGVYYGADLLSDTDLETLSVQVEYIDGTVKDKEAYIVYQTGDTADYEYIDLSDTEGIVVVTIKD